MGLSKRYNPLEVEQQLSEEWQRRGVYQFDIEAPGPVYSIDTPPPTVSGHLHLGHVYSYTHPDILARFWRMKGYRVFYPMGFDDNGLPTERLVEKRLGVSAAQIGRQAFIEKCLQVSEQAEQEYLHLWKRLGLSVDWRYSYRTIDRDARRISQLSFIELYHQGRAYRKEAPAIWCPECRTTIAQADLDDLERASEFVTLAFHLPTGEIVPIATTRPELLPACVAVFYNPEDSRYHHLLGQQLTVPLFGQSVPVLTDPAADPKIGSGLVMCCTFGDSTDVAWWYSHQLPLVEALGKDGRLTATAGEFAGLTVNNARQQIKQTLNELGFVLGRQPTQQTVRVHERCDTPVEYVVARQWFIRVLDVKAELLERGEEATWYPEHMRSRYRTWVENLNWDWCISRQRYYGVPFPLWYCRDCGEVILAEIDDLPVDPVDAPPGRECTCGSTSFYPEEDILDTWATSSMTPQIVGQWLSDDARLFQQVFPYSLRPQAHEIIRTWAFYTIAKSHFHFQELPWAHILISGWGLAGEGMGKISKSRGGDTMAPLAMIERYSADAVRYWASSTGPGRDAIVNEEKIQAGARLVTKLWNVARFCEPFLVESPETEIEQTTTLPFTPADRWILSQTQHLVARVTDLLIAYDYAAAKGEIETVFWQVLADNYLEMCKQRLYDKNHAQRAAAIFTLRHVLGTLVKLFAPFFPYITEEVYQGLFASHPGQQNDWHSIHTSSWPVAQSDFAQPQAEVFGERLVDIASAVRRYKSENSLSLGSEIKRLSLATADPDLQALLQQALPDLASVCRATQIELCEEIEPGLLALPMDGQIQVAITV